MSLQQTLIKFSIELPYKYIPHIFLTGYVFLFKQVKGRTTFYSVHIDSIVLINMTSVAFGWRLRCTIWGPLIIASSNSSCAHWYKGCMHTYTLPAPSTSCRMLVVWVTRVVGSHSPGLSMASFRTCRFPSTIASAPRLMSL